MEESIWTWESLTRLLRPRRRSSILSEAGDQAWVRARDECSSVLKTLQHKLQPDIPHTTNNLEPTTTFISSTLMSGLLATCAVTRASNDGSQRFHISHGEGLYSKSSQTFVWSSSGYLCWSWCYDMLLHCRLCFLSRLRSITREEEQRPAAAACTRHQGWEQNGVIHRQVDRRDGGKHQWKRRFPSCQLDSVMKDTEITVYWLCINSLTLTSVRRRCCHDILLPGADPRCPPLSGTEKDLFLNSFSEMAGMKWFESRIDSDCLSVSRETHARGNPSKSSIHHRQFDHPNLHCGMSVACVRWPRISPGH